METRHQVIEMKRTLQAGRERVFAALTDASRLREWLSREARTEPQPGGWYTLHWSNGCKVRGTFVEVNAPDGVTLSWQAAGDLDETVVEWTLKETDGGTEVTLRHSGFGSGPRWEAVYSGAERRWAEGLRNLQSILEDGVDLREEYWSLLGLYTEEIDAERAEREGIALEPGCCISVRIIMKGGAAEAAGLQKGDVFVAVGGRKVTDRRSWLLALEPFGAGDTVDLELIRGQQKLTIPVTLSLQKAQDVPEEPGEAATLLRQYHARYNAMLAEATAGLTEEEAGLRAFEKEWSAKEILAHLIVSERVLHQSIAETALGIPREGWTIFWPDLFAATIAAAGGTLAGLLERFARDQEESALLIENLSETTRGDRFRYRTILQTPFSWGEHHVADHIEQIRRTVKAVKSGSGCGG